MMAQEALVATFLGKTDLFGSLSDTDRVTVARQMRPAKFSSGQMIFARGDEGRDIYLLLEGRVRFSVLSMDGRTLSFNHARKGDVFGEIAALDGGVRTADAMALARVEAMMLTQAALNRLIDGNARIAHAVIAFLCMRLRVMSERAEMIALYPVEVRLARFLFSALSQQPSPGRGDNIPLNLEMSQNELALLVGASRQKVNRALGYLEDQGAIERRGRIIICNAEKLARIVEAS